MVVEPKFEEDVEEETGASVNDSAPSITALKPDAVSTGSSIQFLSRPIEHHRSLSSGSRAHVDAQKHQIEFSAHRLQLEKNLNYVVEILDSIINLNRESTIQVPADLQILHVDMRLGSSGIAGNTPPPASMVESRFLQVHRHAHKLQTRLRDTVSRVLITGDLNAGKSSLCNSLLRRKVLPVDQQPCTDVFCEVIDCNKNNGLEEVHAVPLDSTYDPTDQSTYVAFSVSQLNGLVHLADEYKLLVVYVKDPRAPSESLLANGVVDICLIDAPGLNVSEVTTTELFGRQEEIDLVIFVVNAENHFTQSAKEFVKDTAREKSLLFIAVNNFDKIQDKERCKARVLKQVASLAPETHKGATDFIHFVSSDPNSTPSGSPPPSSEPEPDPVPESNTSNRSDLDQLEMSLRNFVLDKRSASKLSPAKTFLVNILDDLANLAEHNQKLAKQEKQNFNAQLEELAPSIDSNMKEYAHISEQIERDTERLCSKLLTQSEEFLGNAVNRIGESTGIAWNGLSDFFEYVSATRETLVQRVLTAVTECEEEARALTGSAVDSIKQLGVLHVGNQPAFGKVFNSSAMFSRKKDNLSRLITADFSLLDIFDISLLLERPLPVLNSSKQALVSAAATNASVSSALGGAVTALGVYQGLLGGGPAILVSSARKLFDIVGIRRIALPAVLLAIVALGTYVVHELPRNVPRKLARKLAYEIDELGYVRSNAERIASECRKVLRYPAQDVRAAFQSRLESRSRQREEYESKLKEAEHVINVFHELTEKVKKSNDEVRLINL